jgi:hypothetical protein
VENNFQLLEICLQKGTLTVADCLEQIFVPSKNDKYSTLLDFATGKNVEVLTAIFKFLQKMQQYGTFTIEPYVQQVMNSENLNKKQKEQFEKLYKSYFSGNPAEQLAAKIMPSSALTNPQKTALVLNLIQTHQLQPEHEAVLKQFHDQLDKEMIFTKMHQIPQEQHTAEYQRTLSLLIRALPQENHTLHWGHLIRENHHADIAVSPGAGIEAYDNGASTTSAHFHPRN